MNETATLFDIPVKPEIQTAFEQFDEENPQVYEQFCELVDELITYGHKRYSADGILHIVRYSKTKTNGVPFKINNDFTAYYARKFINLNPDKAYFFETRKSKADGDMQNV